MHRILLHALTLVLIAGGAIAPAAEIDVAPGHPRIYLRPGDEEALRQRVATRPAIAVFYDQLKSRIDSTRSRHSNDEVAGFELKSIALCHVLEAPSPAYRDKALALWLRTDHRKGSISHWDLPFNVMGQAIALDWMWDDLTPAQRTALGKTLVAMMDDLEDYAPHDLGPNPRWASQMSDYSNQLYYHLGSLAFAGAVLADEGIADQRAAEYLRRARQLIVDHMLPAMNQEAGGDDELELTEGFRGNGGWGEDMGHLSMTHPFFGRMLEAWRTATGEDFFPQANGLRTINQYLYYLRRPGGNLSPKGNGTYNSALGDKHMGSLGSLTSARYGDRFGKRIKDLAYVESTFGLHQLEPILWYDDRLEELDEKRLPKAIHFQGQGEIVVRSGFEPHDTWVYLRCGPIYNGHQHDDQGNLLIEGHGGELFVENAANGRYATSYHNTLRVGGDQIRYGSNQVQYVQPMRGTRFERGKITEFLSGEDYHYAAADFGNAYNDAAVPPPRDGRVTRELVVILPDIVVVRDRVRSPQESELLLHTWARPGASTEVDREARALRVIEGSGHGWVKTLLPESAVIEQEPFDATHRITIRPSDAAGATGGQQTFLHVFYLSPAEAAYIPRDAELVHGEKGVGVALSDHRGTRWEVRFDRNAVGLAAVEKNGTPAAAAAPQQ